MKEKESGRKEKTDCPEGRGEGNNAIPKKCALLY